MSHRLLFIIYKSLLKLGVTTDVQEKGYLIVQLQFMENKLMNWIDISSNGKSVFNAP